MGIKGATKAEHLVLRWQKSANLRDCYLENAKGKVSFGGEGNTSLRGGATAAEGTDGSGMVSHPTPPLDYLCTGTYAHSRPERAVTGERVTGIALSDAPPMTCKKTRRSVPCE